MENKKVTVNFGGIGTLLTIAFIVMKLCGVIAWPWLWVLAPLWISVALSLLIFIIVTIIVVIGNKRHGF